jgi:hypothetical protein
MSWLDTEGDEQSLANVENSAEAMRQDVEAGTFWADRIKHYRDEPRKRLEIAMENLPLPAAFREAAIATRAIIRAKRKNNESYDEELDPLYWLAAIDSFMLPYAERLKEPGYNAVASIPGAKIRSLSIDYRQLGYRELELLNKTDTKWLVRAWGEPEGHTTLNQLHQWLWDEYEEKLIEKRQKEREQAIQGFRQLANGGDAAWQDAAEAPSTAGWLGVIAFLLVLAVLIGASYLLG